MTILEFYTSLLSSMSYTTVENGAVIRETADGYKPVKLDGKDLVLPTPEFQSNPDWEHKVAYHPLSESIARGESEVLQLTTALIASTVTDYFMNVGKTLLCVAADESKQTKLTPSQSRVLAAVSKADSTTVENYTKIMSRVELVRGDEDRRLIAIFMRRGGQIGQTKMARMFNAVFPLHEELKRVSGVKDAKDRKVWGVPVRVSDVQVLLALHDTIFPGIDEEAYKAGSNSNVAPYFAALLNGYSQIAGALNTVIKPFLKVDKALKLINTDWDTPDLSVYKNKIPPMPYNEGVQQAGVTSTAPAASPVISSQPVGGVGGIGLAEINSAPVHQQPQMQPQQMQQSTAPAQQTQQGAVSWNDLAGKVMHQQPGMMMPGMYPGMYPGMPGVPMMQPMPGMMQPPMQPMQPMQPGMVMGPSGPQLPMPTPQYAQQQPGMMQPGGYPGMMPGMQPPMQPMQPMQPMMYPGMQPMQMGMPGPNGFTFVNR